MSLEFSDGGRVLRYEAVGTASEVLGAPEFLAVFDRFFGGGGVGDAVARFGNSRLRLVGGGACDVSSGGCVDVDGATADSACVGSVVDDLGTCGGVTSTGSVVGAETCGGGLRDGSRIGDLSGGAVKGKCYAKNRAKREKRKKMRENWRGSKIVSSGDEQKSDSAYGSGGSVCTVDTRTGVEIEAAQTLAACRVAENRKREAEAKVAAKLAEHRLVALQDKDRTVAVQRLAAARYEQRINEAKAKSQASYKKCDESMKSLGSTGSAGEFALKQAVKEARDNAKTLKYVQEQADLFYQYATPEVRRMVAEMPEPEMEDEFDVFGDCPSDYNDEQREAYYDDLNRRNAEHGLVGSSPVPPRRELTPEEFLKIEEEIRALSANQV